MAPLKVVLFGHSFVRRFKEFLNDFVSTDLNVGLPESKFVLKCIGLGGLSLHQRRRVHSVDSVIRESDLVIIDIGSNDLCDLTYSPEKLATDLVSYAAFLVEGLQVRTVVVTQILCRSKVPDAKYNGRVTQTNAELQRIIDGSNLPIVYWRHRGMWNCKECIFCPDGVHLSNSVGYPKYLRSMRDCIIRVTSWFC